MPPRSRAAERLAPLGQRPRRLPSKSRITQPRGVEGSCRGVVVDVGANKRPPAELGELAQAIAHVLPPSPGDRRQKLVWGSG